MQTSRDAAPEAALTRIDVALLRVVWPQLAAVALLLALAAAGSWMLAAARAYVGGESYWSKAQKEAVVHLLRYSREGDEADYRRFMANIDVTLGDRQARLEMDRPDYDHERAVDGFLRGRNHPDDILGMIVLYRWFGWYPGLRHAVEVWTQGDAQIDRLLAVAREMRLQGNPPMLESRVQTIHEALAPLEDEFSASIAETARQLAAFVLALQFVVALVLMLLAGDIARRVMSRADRAEGALRDVSDRLELVLEGSNDGHWDWDVTHGSLFLSERFKEQLGYDAAHPLEPAMRTLQPLHPDDVTPFRSAMQRLIDGRAPLFSLDLRMQLQGGGYRWFHARGKAIRDAGGAAHRVSGAMTDIDERIRTQAALAASEALNRGLFEAAHDAVLVIDTAGAIHFANPAVQAMFGYAPQEVLNQPAALLGPEPPQAGSIGQAVQAALVQSHGSRLPVTGRRKSGEDFPLELSFREMHIGGERMFAAFLRDVSAWTASREAVEQSMALLDATQAMARVGGWEVDVAGGNRVYWTRQMYALLELSPDSFEPTVENTLQFFAPEARPVIQRVIADAVERQKPHDVELEMITASGRRIWVHSRGHLSVQDGRTLRRTSTVRDITQHKLAELKQQATLQRQEQMARQLDLALRGARVALWSFEPPTGRVTHVQRWEIFGHAFMPSTYEEWKSLVHPDDLPQWQNRMERYLNRGWGLLDDESEFRLRRADGTWVWVRGRGQVVNRGSDGAPLLYAGVVMDISAQVTARQVVDDQRQFLETMVEGVDTGVMISSDTRVVYANASFRRALGLPAADLADEFAVEGLFEPADWERELRRRQSLAAGIAVPSAVYNLRARNGAPVQMALNLSRVVWNGQPHYINTVTPLTEHAMLQLQLEATHRRFERVLISELEAQQAHIARELHDSLGSELAGLSLMLGSMKGLVTDAKLARHMEMALEQVASSAEVARTLARGLMPVGSHAGAFWRAMERLAADLTRVKGVACDFSMQGNLDGVPGDVGSHLYRIAQEAVTNAIRHGKATRVGIHLEQTGRRYTMWIRDNGCGFDPARLAGDRPGLGLRSMQARAKALGGQLQFVRADGDGCHVKVTWSSAAPAVGAQPLRIT